MSHPDDEKYRKIRLYNKAFQERVAHIEGALMFLEAIGFEKKCLPHEGKDEEFYVLPNQVSCDSLNTYKELLLSTEPVTPSLHHNPQLYEVAGRYNRFELPNSFYNMSLEEIKREQKLKSEAIERESILRTKAMRERDEVRASVRYYKYVVLRIRFPENIILQGVFRPQHKLSDVRQFICNELIDPTLIFNLHHLHQCLNDDKASLAQLGLVISQVTLPLFLFI
jgi:UBX domain-containing protein 6